MSLFRQDDQLVLFISRNRAECDDSLYIRLSSSNWPAIVFSIIINLRKLGCLCAEENYNPKSDKGQCGLTAFAPDREWKKVVDIFGGKMYNNNREYIGELGSKL